MKMSSFDEVMTWKLEIATPDNEKHSATVTVVTKGGQHYAWISSKDHELPVRDISVQGDQVVLKVATETRARARRPRSRSAAPCPATKSKAPPNIKWVVKAAPSRSRLTAPPDRGTSSRLVLANHSSRTTAREPAVQPVMQLAAH